MDEIWCELEEFPDYSVSNYARIRNEKMHRMVRLSQTGRGVVKVGLFKDGCQFTRSVKILEADAFLPGRTEKFDTPMHLDGDHGNNWVDNLVWRPRWFAHKYSRQFAMINKYTDVGPIVERRTGDVYRDVVDAAMINGLLFAEVYMSLVTKEPVFPNWAMFDWIEV